VKTLSVISFVCLLSSVGFAGTYSGGSGNPNDPYIIANANDMQEIGAISDDWHKHFELIADIDLGQFTGTAFNIIGDPWPDKAFTGIFNGNDHVISNFTYNTSSGGYIGLFGCIGEGGKVKNLGLVNANINADSSGYVGGLCGENWGKISNCYLTGLVIGGASLGGLCGKNSGYIRNCYSTCSVTGGQFEVGGLCGSNGNTISNCFASGPVTGVANSKGLGGLCGENGGYIRNCYSTGSVIGGDNSSRLGGLCGYNSGGIDDCYLTGSVSAGVGSEKLGGLCGENRTSSYVACFWDSTVNPTLADCGYDYGTDSYDVDLPNVFAETTANMQKQSTFTDVGWDFIGETNNGTNEAWEITPGSYPVLSSQNGYVPLELTGDGTLENPYLISDVNELGAIYHYQTDAHYQLTADIDFEGITWSAAPILFLDGTFNGDNHVITNLTIEGGESLGLVGRIGAGGEVKDIGLVNVSISGSDWSRHIGGLCGYNRDGSISNCYVTGSISAGVDSGDIAGLCGSTNYGSISNCYSDCSVSSGNGSRHLGGITGKNNYNLIINCYATGSVTGGDDSLGIGGLCGWGYMGSIINSYSTGPVTSGENSRYLGGLCAIGDGSTSNSYSTGPVVGGNNSYGLGGLIGISFFNVTDDINVRNSYSTGSVTGGENSYHLGGLCGEHLSGILSDCYSTGSVSAGGGSEKLGGLCGYKDNGGYVACFWDSTVNPTLADCGYDDDTHTANVDLPEVFAEITGNMQALNTFITAGWDFINETPNGNDDIWSVCEGTNYPRFVWQIPAGDYFCPDGVAFEDFAFFAKHWLETDYGTVEGAELTGDGFVGIEDLLALVDYWLLIGCGECDGRDMTGEGNVDLFDFSYMGQHWLQSEYGDCGGAELTGDGIVDVDDLMLFSEHWLEGVE